MELKGAKGVIVADDQKRGFLEFMKSYNQSLVDKVFNSLLIRSRYIFLPCLFISHLLIPYYPFIQ